MWFISIPAAQVGLRLPLQVFVRSEGEKFRQAVRRDGICEQVGGQAVVDLPKLGRTDLSRDFFYLFGIETGMADHVGESWQLAAVNRRER